MKQQNPSIRLSYPENESSEIVIDFYNVKKVLAILRALNHKSRERLLEHLDDLGDAATLENLMIQMRLEKDVLEQHLRMLLRNRLIYSSKNAANQSVYYKNVERLLQVKKFLDELNQ